MDDLIVEFLTETNDSLGELDNAIVLLEQDPNNADLLSKIFRVMHTIKGTSGFLGLPRLGRVAHKTEDLLGLFRDGKKQATPSNVTLILESIDCIKAIIVGIETEGKEPEGDDSELVERLEVACGEEAGPAATSVHVVEAVDEFAHLFVPVKAGEPFPTEDAVLPPVESVMENLSQKPAEPLKGSPAVAAAAPSESALAAQSLRVNVDVLEDLMTMVSELVLTRNQILQISRALKDTALTPSLQRLNHIVSDLQEGVMKTRMQPVGNAWSKLPRIVRDISSELGKKIELEMHGQDTELDRQVLEMIKDPLTHMVRNSCDHGIETPGERLAAGKTEGGKIRLSSWHEGGHIIIEIADDGKGLPVQRIKDKILKNGLASEAEIAEMSTQQIQQYIFHAGFSTAEKITSVSGRGVGMDVVRSNIEKISGSIEMDSVEGQGTTFTIKIPLTLAIVSALIIGIGEERFALPQLDVRELVMTTAEGPNRIETINGSPVFRLRDRLLPLICLRNHLQLDNGESLEDRPRYIAVIYVGGFRFGLIVDRVFDTEEIVVKPVASLLRNIQAFSGNTILGDGQVIMILDPSGIMKSSGIMKNAGLIKDQDVEAVKASSLEKERSLLLFYAGNKSLKAVPLEHVSRLEEIDLSAVEWAGQQRVIQYGNTLIPLHTFDSDQVLPQEGRRPVIVFSTRAGLSGLIVDRILDITNFRGEYQITSDGKLEGSAIIHGQTTDVISLGAGTGQYNGHENGANGAGHVNGTHLPDIMHHEANGGLNGEYSGVTQ
jgi:two-component system chemotaxis sensor kinase CheA